MRLLLSAALVPALAALTGLAGPALAQINGFNNGLGFTANATNAPGLPAVSGGSLTLTDNNPNFEATSFFFNTPQIISTFTASFSYQAGGDMAGDGFTFVLQNDPSGASALGSGGGYLGYGGTPQISNSAAVEFNLYTPYGQGTRLGTNGVTGVFGTNGGYQPTAPLNFSSGDLINVQLAYNGTALTESLTDPAANTAYSTSYAVNLASVVGGPTAYVGFTGGDASAQSIQTVSNFEFDQPAAVPETSTIASLGLLLTLGLGGLVLSARRRNAASAG